ncbi:MAG: DUF2164 domain-containing protein [Campylobacterales bacterium]|nr:DUF2164 domain-containing protein [Campylobacterales bacterium]
MHPTFTTQQKADLVLKIKAYCEKELDYEIGGFDAEFLLEFFASQIGGHFYNQGLQDATRAIKESMASLEDRLYSMEEMV